MVQMTSLLIRFAFFFEMCSALDSSSSSGWSVDELPSAVYLTFENHSWSNAFRLMRENAKDVAALKAVNLYEADSNATTTLEKRFFHEMIHLRLLNITDSGIARVDENSFEGLTKLEVVNLNGNRVIDVPQLLFRGCERLKEVYLSGNLIKTLPQSVFSTNTLLSVLDLSYNYLEAISSTELFRKTNLKFLHLEGNRISTIYKNTFTELRSLEFLNISHNEMSFSAIANCDDRPVSYPENYIWLVDMAVKTNSCVIDLSHNRISGLPLAGIRSTCNTQIHNRCKRLTLMLEGNPLSCDCEGYDLIRYFQKAWPSNVMEAVRINSEPTCTSAQRRERSSFAQVDIESIYCTLNMCPNCPAGCSCRLRKHTHTVVVNCTKNQLDSFPRNLPVGRDVKSEFWFRDNRISSIDDIKYPPYQVRVLALSNNTMRELPKNFAKFTHLEILELDDNNLRILTPDHVKHLIVLDLDRLTLGNNPWNCSDCRILSLVKYLRNSSNVISDRKNVLCSGGELSVAEVDLDMCKAPSAYLQLILGASFLSLTILAIILLLLYKMRPGMFVNYLQKSKDAEAKLYDAFVSYAHQDEEYVVSLVRNLEAGQNPFKICLHSRDWMPGEFIVKQMADSVNNSRASVIVLSTAYFRSKWCHSEFRIALTQMLVRRNHKVIVIWLSDEDPSVGKLDPDVRLYISACTYLKYDDKRFLDKLESALCKREHGV